MAASYFLNCGVKVSGPTNAESVKQFTASGMLRATDRISTSADGPWYRVCDVSWLASELPGYPINTETDAVILPPTSRSTESPSKKQAGPLKQRRSQPRWLLPVIAFGGILALVAAGALY